MKKEYVVFVCTNGEYEQQSVYFETLEEADKYARDLTTKKCQQIIIFKEIDRITP